MNETPMNSCPFLSLVINQFTFTFQKPLIRTGFWTEVHPHLLHPLRETKVHKNAPILFLLQPNGAIAASCPAFSIFRSAGFPQAWPDAWHFHNTPTAFWLLRVVPLLRTHQRQSFPGVPPCQSLVN